MDLRIFVPGEADEAHLSLLLGFAQRLSRAVGADEQVGIVVEGDAVNLPEVEMIGLQPAQRLFQHLHRQSRLAAVGADLGHQEDLVATALQAFAHPDLRLAAVVLPAVVEEGDAAVDGLLHEANRCLLVGRVAQVMATHTQGRDLDVALSELAKGNAAAVLCHRSNSTRRTRI